MEKDDTTLRIGRRSRTKNERVLRAIVLARKRSEDEYQFAERVNAILLAEKMVTMDEFGILCRKDSK